MKYIKVKNDGLIEPQALHLVGASSKRNDSTKIGQFGSGNKYALAYLLRNGYDVKVFSGTKEIEITTKKDTFREQEFNVIYIDGEKTSITTEMGKDWQFWQALREIYCNAMDEGNFSFDFVQDIDPKEDETHFYIDTKKDVMEFVGNFDNYFATKKKVLFECEAGKILEKTGETINIYRKGIKCFETDKKGIYDYDFSNIMIDENRLVRYYWTVEEKIWDLIYQCDNEEVIMNILHNSANTEFLESCISDISTINSSRASETFKKVIKSIRTAPKGYSGLLKPDEVHNHVIVPTKVFESVRGYMDDENVGDSFKVNNNSDIFRPEETTPLQDASIKEAMKFFEECDFKIDFPIKTCIFQDKDILGCAYEGTIWLSDICLTRGVNEIVTTIIEEYIHLKYKCKDKTRKFQDSVISEFVDYMKKKNAYVL